MLLGVKGFLITKNNYFLFIFIGYFIKSRIYFNILYLFGSHIIGRSLYNYNKNSFKYYLVCYCVGSYCV